MESVAYLVRPSTAFFNSIISRPKMAKGKYPRVQALRISRYRAALGGIVALIMLVLLVLVAAGIVSFPIMTDISSSSWSSVVGGTPGRHKQWAEILSWEPRVVLYHNFLSKEECEHLISLAKPRLLKSTVINSNTGQNEDSSVRTSKGMFLNRGHNKIVEDIERRIALFTHIPVEHGEELQIQRYEFGQKYEPHFDYYNDPYNIENGGQRMATMLMYLSDVEEGGETVFPKAKANFSAVPWWDERYECGKMGLSVKPKMGNAVLLWNTKPDGSVDPTSLHGSCPVIKGDKWSAPKWMHLREYKVQTLSI